MKHNANASHTSASKQLTAFLDKFEPQNAKLIRACRAELRKLLPTAHQLLYDNYNFFVIGFAASERASDCIVSIAAAANGVVLSFYRGASLADPKGLLLGSGKQNRFIRLASMETLKDREVLALIRAAAARANTPLPTVGRGQLIVKSVSVKQRRRR